MTRWQRATRLRVLLLQPWEWVNRETTSQFVRYPVFGATVWSVWVTQSPTQQSHPHCCWHQGAQRETSVCNDSVPGDEKWSCVHVADLSVKIQFWEGKHNLEPLLGTSCLWGAHTAKCGSESWASGVHGSWHQIPTRPFINLPFLFFSHFPPLIKVAFIFLSTLSGGLRSAYSGECLETH